MGNDQPDDELNSRLESMAINQCCTIIFTVRTYYISLISQNIFFKQNHFLIELKLKKYFFLLSLLSFCIFFLAKRKTEVGSCFNLSARTENS